MSFTQQRFIIPFLSPILFLSIYGRKKKSHTLRSFSPLPKNGRQWLFFVNVFCIFFLFLYILGRFIILFWLLSLSFHVTVPSFTALNHIQLIGSFHL